MILCVRSAMAFVMCVIVCRSSPLLAQSREETRWLERVRSMPAPGLNFLTGPDRQPGTVTLEVGQLTAVLRETPTPVTVELVKGDRVLSVLGTFEPRGQGGWAQRPSRDNLLLIRLPDGEYNKLLRDEPVKFRMKVRGQTVLDQRIRMPSEEDLLKALQAKPKQTNPAVVDFNFSFLKYINQVNPEIRLTGVVKNIGPAPFKYSGNVVLYRGNQVLKKLPFGQLTSGATVTITHDIAESYQDPPTRYPFPDYVLKIEYDKVATPAELDGDYGNNEKSLKQTTIYSQYTAAYLDYYRQGLLKAINDFRGQNGAVPLVLDAKLNQAAQAHSEWMWANKTFSHTGANGSDHIQRCLAAGTTCSQENIYQGSDTPPDACESWKKSTKGHKETMINNSYKRIGIGLKGGYVTADFGK